MCLCLWDGDETVMSPVCYEVNIFFNNFFLLLSFFLRWGGQRLSLNYNLLYDLTK